MFQCTTLKFVVFLMSTILTFACYGQSVSLEVTVAENNRVQLNVSASACNGIDSCSIYRSHVNLHRLPVLHMGEMPITKKVLEIKNKQLMHTDSLVADNCLYFYYVKIVTPGGKTISSDVKKVWLSNRDLPQR